MKAFTLYTYSNCDTCRRAVKWLRGKGIDFTEKPIRETPPSLPELRAMAVHQGGELRRLFNSSGRDYREQRLGEKLDALSDSAALGLLAQNGNLVKRPFLIGDGIGLVGFNEGTWTQALIP